MKIKQKKIKILNNKQCLFTIRVNLHIFISKIFEIRLNKHSIKYFFFKLAVYWISNRQNKINGDNIQFYLKVYNTKCHKYNSNWNVPLQFAISVMFLLCHFALKNLNFQFTCDSNCVDKLDKTTLILIFLFPFLKLNFSNKIFIDQTVFHSIMKLARLGELTE